LRRVVFANADRAYAERVLDVLGVHHQFEQIIDVRDFAFNSKPHVNAYHRILEILDAHPYECILVEDSPDNLAPAKAMGMLTVLVGGVSALSAPSRDGAHVHIVHILDLADAIRPWTAG